MPANKKPRQPVNKTEEVDKFMDKFDHPFKAEVYAVRDIIKAVNKDIAEKIILSCLTCLPVPIERH